MKSRLDEIKDRIRALDLEVGRSPEGYAVQDILMLIHEELTSMTGGRIRNLTKEEIQPKQ